MLPRTRGDAIQLWHSGSPSLDAQQIDPDLSLGGLRSSTRAAALGYLLGGSLAGLRLDYAAGENGTGVGSLDAVGAGSVRWTPPGGTPGPAVPIANGTQALLEGGGTGGASKFVLVTRTTAADLAGGYSVELVPVFNSVFGAANVSVPGGTTYRLVVLKNGPSQAVQGLKVWLGTCDHVVALAKEFPASQPDGAFQVVTNESTAPVALTFVAPDSAAHANVITATLNPNEQIGIWIRFDATAAVASPRVATTLRWSFVAVG